MKNYFSINFLARKDTLPWEKTDGIPAPVAHGYVLLWVIWAAWIAYAAICTGYWATRQPVESMSFDLSKKTKPTGILLDEFHNRQPVDFQEAAKGHWTLVVFTVLGSDSSMVGYQVGDDYTRRTIHQSAVGVGDILNSLRTVLPSSVELWVVRLDPSSPHSADQGIVEKCNHCTHRFFTAAYKKGGRYGNYYDETQKWYVAQFASKIHGEPVSETVPSYAIIDPEGYLRTMHPYFVGGDVYADFVALTGRRMMFEKTVREQDSFKPQQHWYDVYRDTFGMIVGTILVLILFLGILLPSPRYL
jgi:hypothetical protein